MRGVWWILVGVVACSSPTAAGGDGLEARHASGELILSTDSAEPYYYFAVDGALLPGINWALCTVPSECRRVARGAPVHVSLQELQLRSRDVAVYYWHLMRQGETYVPDTVRVVGVRW